MRYFISLDGGLPALQRPRTLRSMLGHVLLAGAAAC